MTAPSDASRREVLKVVGAGASGVAVAAVVGLPRAQAPRPAPVAAEVDPLANHPHEIAAAAKLRPDPFLADLVGQAVGNYRVQSVGGLDRGGIPVVLATLSGGIFRVDILRVDPTESKIGIGAAGAVSVYLRNGGDGQTVTNEEQGLGAMALAEALLARERNGARPPHGLLTRGEREALDSVAT